MFHGLCKKKAHTRKRMFPGLRTKKAHTRKTSSVQMPEMTPLEPEVADEVADEFDKFDNQCPANPFFRVAWPSDMDRDQDWLQCLK